MTLREAFSLLSQTANTHATDGVNHNNITKKSYPYDKTGATTMSNNINYLNLLLETKTPGIDANTALQTLLEFNTVERLSSSETLALAWLVQAAQKKALAKLKPSDSPFKLASLFRAKKDVRYYLNAIYSDGEKLLASDGHTLIRINHTVPKGFYHDNGIVNSDIEAVFPDFMRVYNTKNTQPYNECNPLDTNNERDMVGAKKPFQVVHVASEANKTGTWFNADYIDRARRAGATAYYLCDGNLYFTGPNFDGFVMQIRK